jgi:hypothetical protein
MRTNAERFGKRKDVACDLQTAWHGVGLFKRESMFRWLTLCAASDKKGLKSMRKLSLISAAVAVTLALPVHAKTRYETYEGRNSVAVGQGGSRLTKGGIDFWNTGDPPRRYQVIGIIRDNRGTGALFGNAVGSSGIAKLVLKAGGDAVIILNEASSLTGVWTQGNVAAYGNQAYASGLAIPIQERVTTMAVIKYLPDEASPKP